MTSYGLSSRQPTGEPYLIASCGRDGIYMAFEVIPGLDEGTATFAESPADLAEAITRMWTPIDIYTGDDAELAENLGGRLPDAYTVRAGQPSDGEE